MTSYLNLDAIANASKASEPYRHFQGENFLRAEKIDAVERDYPKLKNAGFLTLQEIEPEGAFAGFMDEMQGAEFSAAVSDALQFDLTKRPKLITIMRLCPKRAGRIHTDGKAKLATMLTYFNRTWPAGHAGAIRVLKSEDNIDDYVAEVPPLMGNIFGFLRSDSSWHGHLPYEGERKVVQITWLESEEAVERKKRNNAFAQALKSLGFKKSAA
ncbi:MAG TPA: 2OG-Fe(II) oxygenase [Caulobacterales bacterium]|nr:2OG-Fe(II) oxygenase [Caulobacterales bacterium]